MKQIRYRRPASFSAAVDKNGKKYYLNLLGHIYSSVHIEHKKMVATDDNLSQNAHQHAEDIMRIVTAICLVPSVLVAMTFLVFREMQNKVFFKCIFMMTLADIGLYIVSFFGFLQNGSALCWAQGILAIYFPLASWFWTTVLYYCVFSVVYFEKIVLNMFACQCFCWGFPLVLSLLPITTSNYGAASVNTQWCLIINRSDTPYGMTRFWSFASFFGWFFVCILLMCIWTVLIFRRMIWQESTHKAIIFKVYDKLWLYPFSMFVCWILNFLVQFVQHFGSSPVGVLISMLLGILNGFLSALIFFWKSREARSRWSVFIQELCSNQKEPETSFDNSTKMSEGSRCDTNAFHSDAEGYRESTIVGGSVHAHGHGQPKVSNARFSMFDRNTWYRFNNSSVRGTSTIYYDFDELNDDFGGDISDTPRNTTATLGAGSGSSSSSSSRSSRSFKTNSTRSTRSTLSSMRRNSKHNETNRQSGWNLGLGRISEGIFRSDSRLRDSTTSALHADIEMAPNNNSNSTTTTTTTDVADEQSSTIAVDDVVAPTTSPSAL